MPDSGNGAARESAGCLRKPRALIGAWLMLCSVLVLGLVFIGGLTRLTGSGLSIVEWKPVSGVIPPLSKADWEREFAAYRAFPEYRLVNSGMTLQAFRRIYWFEFIHRLWGRLIGVALLLPLAFFSLRKWVDRRLWIRVSLLVLLGGAQGAMGWYVVKSGLDQVPAVSAIRLTLHLCLALALCGLLLWFALDELRGTRLGQNSTTLLPWLRALAVLAVFTVASGGLVAGTFAGLNYNTFPLMAGKLIPDGLLALKPWWRNFFESVLTVQFQHRVLAVCLAFGSFFMGLWAWLDGKRARAQPSQASLFLMLIALIQPLLGVLTLLWRVPIGLAVAHQMGGFLLFSCLLWLIHEQRHPAPEAER